jgi:acyl carrier protein
MGLDSVEIVMDLEEEFGIKIRDDEASELRRVGDVVDCVSKKCLRLPRQRCASAHTFYRLRQALMNLAGAPRSVIRPDTALASILPIEIRRDAWRGLGNAGLKLPDLQRPQQLVTQLSALIVVMTGAATVATAMLLGLHNAALFAILFGAVATYVAKKLSAPYATQIPTLCATVKGAVYVALRAPSAQLSRAEIATRVRVIIAEQMGLQLDAVTDDKHLVDDLHVDG